MQYFLEGESKCNSKKVINNKNNNEASTPIVRPCAFLTPSVLHFAACLYTNILEVPT